VQQPQQGVVVELIQAARLDRLLQAQCLRAVDLIERLRRRLGLLGALHSGQQRRRGRAIMLRG
jgi:hypothetical protein